MSMSTTTQPNLVSFSNSIADTYDNQVKKSVGKAIDPATLTTIIQCIVTLVTFIIGLFAKPTPTPTPASIQTQAKNMGFIGKAILKTKLNRYMNVHATDAQLSAYNEHKNGIVNNILSKIGSADEKTLAGVISEVSSH